MNLIFILESNKTSLTRLKLFWLWDVKSAAYIGGIYLYSTYGWLKPDERKTIQIFPFVVIIIRCDNILIARFLFVRRWSSSSYDMIFQNYFF